jgi:hypothetical protein
MPTLERPNFIAVPNPHRRLISQDGGKTWKYDASVWYEEVKSNSPQRMGRIFPP